MSSVDLINLFGITPFSSAAPAKPLSFQGSSFNSAFQSELELNQDRFSTNPLSSRLKSKSEIKQLAKSSPRIMELLKEYDLPLRVNMNALEGTVRMAQGHLATTRILAAKIYSALPSEIKAEVNLPNLQEAAMLHDFGKILIPKEILNKKGALTPEEKKIMELHSEFGYELLKQQGVNEEVLNLIKYHHQKPDGSGYPAVTQDFEFGVSSQILKAADKYSALTEERTYHKPFSREEALNIIYEETEKGVISKEVFEALKKSV